MRNLPSEDSWEFLWNLCPFALLILGGVVQLLWRAM